MTYNPHNIFAQILRGEIPCHTVYENDAVLAFHDIARAAPVHVLIISKRAAVSFDDFVSQAAANEVAEFFTAIEKVALLMNVKESGYRLITNHGANASQTVPHFHVHLLAGRQLGRLLIDDTLRR